MECTAFLGEVTQRDLSKKFVCFAQNSVGNTTRTIQLRKKEGGKPRTLFLKMDICSFWKGEGHFAQKREAMFAANIYPDTEALCCANSFKTLTMHDFDLGFLPAKLCIKTPFTQLSLYSHSSLIPSPIHLPLSLLHSLMHPILSFIPLVPTRISSPTHTHTHCGRTSVQTSLSWLFAFAGFQKTRFPEMRLVSVIHTSLTGWL